MDYQVHSSVFATGRFVGFHSWPDAPNSVLYLRDKHRHLFGYKIEISVSKDDREIEFHMLDRNFHAWLNEAWYDLIDHNNEVNFVNWSCERIATEILDWVRAAYPGRTAYVVTIDEDGENGAQVVAVRDG